MYTNQASRQECQLCLVTFQREPQPEGIGFVNRPCGSPDLAKNYQPKHTISPRERLIIKTYRGTPLPKSF